MKYEVLKARLARTLAGPPLEAETVVGACEILAREILDGKYDQVLEASLGAEMDRPQGANPVMAQARRAARLLSRPWKSGCAGNFRPHRRACAAIPWGCCSMSERGIWRDFRLTARWKDFWLAISIC